MSTFNLPTTAGLTWRTISWARSAAVMISLFVALTLTPMLAARMPPPREREHDIIYHRLEVSFRALEGAYRRLLYWTLAHRGATVGAALAPLLPVFRSLRATEA